MRLELADISREIRGKPILSGISMVVPEGGFSVIIGPTGCGKTTLLRIADLLDRPDAGKVLLDGVDCTDLHGRRRTALRRRLAMVMQRPFMLSGTVERNVRFGLEVRGLKGGDMDLDEVFASTGLEGMESRDARTLSGGEMQKVAIARAVVTRPELLLLDEPLNSVDQGLRPGLRSLIGQLHTMMGMTVLMATHDVTDALSLSDRVVVLSSGKLLQSGETGSILSDPASMFVASFVGEKNIVPVVMNGNSAVAGELEMVIAATCSGRGFISIPPEVISISLERFDSSQRNCFQAEVTRVTAGPMFDTVHLLTWGVPFQATVTRDSVLRLGLQAGSAVWMSFKATSVKVLT